MYVTFDVGEFLTALRSELGEDRFATIISEEQLEVFDRVARDVLSKGQTSHIFGRSDSRRGIQNKVGKVTAGDIECPACGGIINITLTH